MAKVKSIEIIAVNQPHGTMTVRWNGDPDLEWNYNIPFDEDTGEPLEGDMLHRWLIYHSYEQIENTLDTKAERAHRSRTNFDKFNSLRKKKINVEGLADEFEQLRGSQKNLD